VAKGKEDDPRHFLHPQTIARISRLDLRAQHVVEGFISGMHRSYRRGDAVLEYRMTLRTQDPNAIAAFCDVLRGHEEVVEFRIAPAGD